MAKERKHRLSAKEQVQIVAYANEVIGLLEGRDIDPAHPFFKRAFARSN